MRAFRALFFLHAGLLLLVGFGMQPGPVFFAVITLLALSWIGLRRHPVFGFGAKALTRLVWHADGRWTLSRADGLSGDAELLPSSIVHPSVLVLNFRWKRGQRQTRILLGDELPEESLRRLRARLLNSGNHA